MRVLLVVSSARLAGTERHVVELAAGLRAHGVDAEVVCEPGGVGLDGVLAARGVPAHPLALTGAALARAGPRLARLARDFDLLHAHLSHAAAAAAAARLLVGRPVVETRHFLALAHQSRPALRRLAGRARRAAIDRAVDLTLAPSRAVAATVAGPTALVPHGLPAPSGGARRPAARGSRPGPVRFVTVGRLEADRDVALALRGFAAAVARLASPATLTVVGDGGDRQRLQALAARLGLEGQVRFTGALADPSGQLAGADIYLAPATEAFGLATLEAMAAGLPVVGVARGGLLDLIDDGRSGQLVEASPAAFADAMAALAADPLRRQRLGAAAQRQARERFSVARMAERTLAAYRQVVPEAGSPRVLRVYHSGVVAGWRERDRQLRARGVDVTLVAPPAWNEGGRRVALEEGADDFVVRARTVGRHPALFVYDPRPLVGLLRRRRFDVVDVHEEPYSLAAAELRLLRRWLQPRAGLLLYSAQNLPKRYPWPFRQLEAAALAEADGAYVCNTAAAEILRAKGFAGRLRLLPLGVDVERFAPAAGPAPPDGGGLRVGYVGRLEPRKGVDVLLHAVAGRPGWRLRLVGGGPARADLQRLAARLGLDGRVEFAGFAGHEALPDVYRCMDVLAVPSVPTPGWLEQFCRVAVEAMASGVPVVASACGALPEVIADAGVLVAPGDAEALGAALEELAGEPGRRRQLGRRGRRRAERFSWPAVADGHLELYRAVSACASTSWS